jgi:N-acetylmuramoyl-L-alanine amidase
MKRETANYSADFSSTLVGKLKQNIRLSRDPQRSAAFKVLKQTHAPSVLLELGYMSHDEDQKLLGSPAWQKSAAKSISEAVDAFFAKRDTGAASLP